MKRGGVESEVMVMGDGAQFRLEDVCREVGLDGRGHWLHKNQIIHRHSKARFSGASERILGRWDHEEPFRYQRALIHLVLTRRVMRGDLAGWSRDLTDIVSIFLAPIPFIKNNWFAHLGHRSIISYEFSDASPVKFQHTLVPSTGLFFYSLPHRSCIYTMQVQVRFPSGAKNLPMLMALIDPLERHSLNQLLIMLFRRWTHHYPFLLVNMTEFESWVNWPQVEFLVEALDPGPYNLLPTHYEHGFAEAVVEILGLRQTSPTTLRPAFRIWNLGHWNIRIPWPAE